MQTIKCLKHDLNYAYDSDRLRELDSDIEKYFPCPVCVQIENKKLVSEYRSLKENFDVLIKAATIIKTHHLNNG